MLTMMIQEHILNYLPTVFNLCNLIYSIKTLTQDEDKETGEVTEVTKDIID